ncbi:hypothetical protein [Magnetococcus marinus]|uniref:hypothetical protein n=1 Tax=Magnetococcus marinus TaxID=1124597 RepID=UPI00387ED6F0
MTDVACLECAFCGEQILRDRRSKAHQGRFDGYPEHRQNAHAEHSGSSGRSLHQPIKPIGRNCQLIVKPLRTLPRRGVPQIMAL